MTNTTNLLNDLTTRINDFPFFYEMSENQETWDKGTTEKEDLRKELSSCTVSELNTIKSGLTADVDFINRYFSESFENLPEPTPEVEKPQSKLSKIMTAAWFYMRKGIYLNFSACLKSAWKAYRIISKLKEGIVYLTYRKADGATREAIATLRQGNFNYQSKGSEKKSNPSVITYWDLEKKAPRAFRIDRLINVA